MIQLDLEDIIQRLRDLQAYSPTLAQRTEKEMHLPEKNTASALADELEAATRQCEKAAVKGGMPEAIDLLRTLLIVSYRYYLVRLAAADNPWCFRFPEAFECTHSPVATFQ